jgi:hypothetical protein
MGHMDKDGFIIHLEGLHRYMDVDENMSLEIVGWFFLKYLNAQTLNAFIYVSDLQEEAPMDKNSKRKQVHEKLHLIYTTSCREVKEREIVK